MAQARWQGKGCRYLNRESWRRAHVWSLVERLGAGLGVPALSPIVPLVVGGEAAALGLSSRLLAAGLHVPAIRPPTVPSGTCRLRVSLSAAHTNADVDDLISLSGLGPRSSALVAGYTHSHRQLEEGLAALKATEDCLLFPTGFAANLSVLTCLAAAAPAAGGGGGGYGSGVAVFSDELNHASIIDGARLASRGGGGGEGEGARLQVYRHNDLGHLEELLCATPPGVRRLVVTDSLFSMDGDFADLKGLVALKRRQPFLLALDEAHATLVCGEGGGGAAEAMGVADEASAEGGEKRRL
ncbi:putative 8-amino-7-oxononanoate synthase [Tetrabaena socialis]|uniref:Putative 8-amino-7-oxononanoate synthase n=1 Tax=Tetrabaena socialis TaxID=47790 RepID=A0A2J8A7H1_9CHLO|nr:putative 8-amino-7-oxononanoate synthase [Tetrabaena socialis]|eukprot:PNH08471.1 putative 8-amino-7-oxononanoate synthase [Tetrabaena socialis]